MKNNMFEHKGIRLANISDVENINVLYEELFESMETLQPYYWQKAKQDESFIKSIIESAEADILVYEIDNKILGFLLLQEMVTPPYNAIVYHKYAFLMDIAVSKELRGKGIGSELLEAGKEWAKNRKLEYLELNVLSNNLKAFKLYQNKGYKTEMQTMRLKL